MAESMKVQGPVEIKENSAERVAFDLMNTIAYEENSDYSNQPVAKKNSNRLYYLNLYKECLNVVQGYSVPESDSSQG